MDTKLGLRLSLLPAAAVVGAAVALGFAGSAAATTGAVNTSDDPGQTAANHVVTGACLNGPSPSVNCNIYGQKEDVFLSGSPVSASLGAGTYFFAVVVPGGQPDPNDHSYTLNDGDANLSDDYEPWTNREFSVAADGTITNLGGHFFDAASNKLQMAPYADTSNPGGVYVLAVCQVPGTVAAALPAPGVDAHDCKYDAFKVQVPSAPPLTDLTVTKDVTPSFTRTFSWAVAKSVAAPAQQNIASGSSATFDYTVTVTHDAGTDSGWAVSGTISVFNPNASDFSGVNVSDAISAGGAADANAVCSVPGGSNATIPASSHASFAYSCSWGGHAPAASSETNTVTATWDPTQYAATSGSASFSLGFSFLTPTTIVDGSVAVSDPNAPNPPLPATVSYSDPSPTTFSYPVTYSGDPAGTCTTHPNTATLLASDTHTSASASQSVSVCVGADLKVSKTAGTSYTRTYGWSVTKLANRASFDPGGTATYTVSAGETGFTDSKFLVSGTVTVGNPNNWEAITAAVADSIDNGGSCSLGNAGDLASPAAFSLPANGSETFPYSCSFTSNPQSGTNTATATWDRSAASTPDGAMAGTAAYAFGPPTTLVNRTVHVTDSFNGGAPVSLGSATAVDTAPFTAATFIYTQFLTPPASGCVNDPNTATITETGQSSTVSVADCNSGALTMGFWQNKNGQAIVQKYSGANCQALVTWLKQFDPFSDLSAPSCGSSPPLGATTSTGVAGYVYSAVKAATCSSTANTCNSMLRAQMLATALDVYFSDPALGGNRIGATAPIGGLTIDLTHVCQMIDGSAGGSCSGSYENVSTAFGGASSMTVMSMLLYQDTADPLADAGAVWYGNNKATQVLAKDAFDAINNQVATAP